jgi:hypothetical protein
LRGANLVVAHGFRAEIPGVVALLPLVVRHLVAAVIDAYPPATDVSVIPS